MLHTGGDAFVIFRAHRVMHVGDTFSNRDLPIMDKSNGGSGVKYAATLARALHHQARTGTITIVVPGLGEDDVFSRVRCPLCGWRPDSSSRWCCDPSATPEPLFAGCGTVWNTFSTRGQCPGCDHQWRWTSCLSCGGWSLHHEWYEEQRSR